MDHTSLLNTCTPIRDAVVHKVYVVIRRLMIFTLNKSQKVCASVKLLLIHSLLSSEHLKVRRLGAS